MRAIALSMLLAFCFGFPTLAVAHVAGSTKSQAGSQRTAPSAATSVFAPLSGKEGRSLANKLSSSSQGNQLNYDQTSSKSKEVPVMQPGLANGEGADSTANSGFSGTSLSGRAEPGRTTGLSAPNVWLSIAVLVFGLLVVVIEAVFLSKPANNSPTHARNIILVTIVVIAALFLVTAGYSEHQFAPVIGLLGAIAGYLLGTERSMSAGGRSE